MSDTIKPRLEACCADCRNTPLSMRKFVAGLTLDDERIRDAMIEFKPQLVVIDQYNPTSGMTLTFRSL